jgi:hypothetical protein
MNRCRPKALTSALFFCGILDNLALKPVSLGIGVRESLIASSNPVNIFRALVCRIIQLQEFAVGEPSRLLAMLSDR